MFNKKQKKIEHKSFNTLEAIGITAIGAVVTRFICDILDERDRRKIEEAKVKLEMAKAINNIERFNRESAKTEKVKSYNPDERAPLSSTLK
jgi:surface antigen